MITKMTNNNLLETKEIPWTEFWDMHSGGGLKEKWGKIYIQAPEEEAKIIFYNRFGHNPQRVTCTCCGEDYAIDEGMSLKQATGYHRNCRSLETPRNHKTGLYENDDPILKAHYYLEEGEKPPKGYTISESPKWGEYETLEEFSKREDILIIYDKDIKDSERQGSVPEEGYVWV